jgi:hypothetical protein
MPLPETERLFSELNDELKMIDVEEIDLLKRTEKSIMVCEDYLSRLRNVIEKSPFKNTADEIYFFKHIKPKFASLLLYNIYLFNLEYRRAKNQQKIDRKYLEKELKKIHLFIEDNIEFYKYYKTGAAYLDQRYFVRGVKDIHLLLDTRIYYFDEQFSTSHSHLISAIMANDMLMVYIESELKNLERKVSRTESGSFGKLNWTESKTALIELIYAIHSTGAVNNGNVDINDLAHACETMFNVDLDGYYRTYLEVKMRKNNRTKFLDQLRSSLLKRMQEDDQR